VAKQQVVACASRGCLPSIERNLLWSFTGSASTAMRPRHCQHLPPNQSTETPLCVGQDCLPVWKVSSCIETGHLLTFTTDDPENLPLPSVDLLQLQWVLNRLISHSGAADVEDDELDPDDGEGLRSRSWQGRAKLPRFRGEQQKSMRNLRPSSPF
jgi:hypothetical protein